MRCYKEASEPDSLWIKGLFPRGYEVFYQNSVQFIDWTSEVPAGESSLVKIEFSFYGNAGPWNPVADNLPNSGRFQWTVPNTGSSDCYLKFTVTTPDDTISSITEMPFTIIGDDVFIADFLADTTYGEVPLEVHFTDLSLGLINIWIWDFNGDGVFDSFLQNPAWTYEEPGSYDVTLIVSDEMNADTVTKENYINVVLSGISSSVSETKEILDIYPNPFSERVNISVEIMAEQEVSMYIYSTNGDLVKTILHQRRLQQGNFSLKWDGKNNAGEKLKPGIYMLKLQAENTIIAKKLILTAK
jgi:hypothetical protein